MSATVAVLEPAVYDILVKKNRFTFLYARANENNSTNKRVDTTKTPIVASPIAAVPLELIFFLVLFLV